MILAELTIIEEIAAWFVLIVFGLLLVLALAFPLAGIFVLLRRFIFGCYRFYKWLKEDKISLKNKLIEIGVGFYVVGCVAIGIFAGKFLYNHIHAPDQPFSWLRAGLAIFAGILVIGILGIPTHRYALPRCPECESGRLHTETEVLDTYEGPAGIKLYYGMRGTQEFTKQRDTITCDRCGYKSVKEYTVGGNITIH